MPNIMIQKPETTPEFVQFLPQEWQRVAADNPEWLTKIRQESAAFYKQLGLPTMKQEEWRYTNLRKLTAHSFVPATSEKLSPNNFNDLIFSKVEGPRIVIVNGRFDQDLSIGLENINGLTAMSLKAAIQQKPELVESYFGKIAATNNYTFASLNTAIFEDGLFLHVAANAVIKAPLQVIYYSTAESQPSVNHPRSLIIVEQNSQAKLIEIFGSEKDSITFSNAVSEIIVKNNAILEHVKIQRESLNAYHIALIEIHQEKDSRYISSNLSFGGAIVRNDHNVWLGGENIECTLDGVYVINGEQITDNHTKLDHAFANCRSFQVYKGILDDIATGVFNGKIYVHQDAQKTDAKQTNQALLLSEKAVINTKPQLEIYADDVKCTHGATIGQLSKESEFYLRARGISEKDAKSILIYAFAREVIEKISIESLHEDLEAILLAKLQSTNQ